ncbi:MAG: TPM domain-containing protein, partial [Treponema sp.]|nr:TPM domain-containing protein [Treponema sp.]
MKINKFFVSILLSIFLANSIFALSVPGLTSPIVDNANVISDGVEQNINNQLQELSNSTGIQLAVLTIPTLEDEVLESYSMKVAETWKLGSAEKDTGVLLLIALEERSIRIEVGYGLEGVLTDTKCGLIIR